MSAAQEAAAGVVGDLAAEAEPEEASSVPEGAAAEQVQPEAAGQTVFVADPELPDEIAAMLDEPDFEEEAAQEVQAAADEDETFDEYADPQLAEERKKRIAAEKRARFLEERVVVANKSKWSAEAKKYFPFSDPASIGASSRRAFLREAKAQHERVKEIPEIKAMVERGAQSATVVAEEALDLARGEAAEAWGKPLVGAGSVPQQAVDAQQHAEKIASAKTLVERTRLRLQGTNALGLVPTGTEE